MFGGSVFVGGGLLIIFETVNLHDWWEFTLPETNIAPENRPPQ